MSSSHRTRHDGEDTGGTRRPDQDVISLREATRAWFAISLQTFGGPAGQIAVMQRMLVDEKRWIGQQRFLFALSYCTLLPGPEAQQLATYVGWLLNGVKGALVAGILFVLPGVVALLLSPETRASEGPAPAPVEAGDALFEAFDVDPTETTERSIRVAGALSALAVLTVAAHDHGEASLWRPHIVATCLDALGHHRSTPPDTTVLSAHPRPTQTLEA